MYVLRSIFTTSMKPLSFILYILTIALNLFLLLPAIYIPIIAAPLHLLIYYLTFNRLLTSRHFQTNLQKVTFSLIPFLTQVLFILTFLLMTTETLHEYSRLIAAQIEIVILLVLLCLLEFIILYITFSKYQTRKHLAKQVLPKSLAD